jgi:hypothetical protein
MTHPGDSIAQKSDALLAALIRRGCDPTSQLLPGVPPVTVAEHALSFLRLPIPSDVIQLYEWRNGQPSAATSLESLCFREYSFARIEACREEFEAIQRSYGMGNDLASTGVNLAECLPITYYNGGWLVVVCGSHNLATSLPNPVVGISYGIDLYFHSIAHMLDTCLAWTEEPTWTPHQGIPDSAVELRIWRQHNPGVFAGAL